MDPETRTFTSMDTWQGNLYEPVTLHKYLYANANPVKYQDPSEMFSLPELNTTMAVYTGANECCGKCDVHGCVRRKCGRDHQSLWSGIYRRTGGRSPGVRPGDDENGVK